MNDPKHIVCVSGFIENDAGQILLVKTPRRGWEFPGGQVEEGERLPEALLREVREESGCDVTIGRLVGVYSRLSPPFLVVFMFQGRHVSGSPCASEETVDAGWFAVEQAAEMITHPALLTRLHDATDGSQRPVYRSYTMPPYSVTSALPLVP